MVYNIGMDVVAGGTSAAPTYFDPKIFKNGRGETEVLVDGGIIANNPSMYAFFFASEFHNQKNIRVISIGCGIEKQPNVTATTNLLTWANTLGDILVNVEVSSHDYFTDFLADKYKRF